MPIINTDIENLICAVNELIYSRLHEVGGIFNKPISQDELRKLKILTEKAEKVNI